MADAARTPEARAREDAQLLKLYLEYRTEAEEARKTRILRNRLNWEAYYGRQDWTHKQDGQSREFLPKTSEAVEQLAAFTKRALTQFGDWFDVKVPANSPLSATEVRRLLRMYLERMLVGPRKYSDFATIISQGLKAGALESLVVLKVHGHKAADPLYEGGSPIAQASGGYWKLRIDLIPTSDYYPDPTGRGLYEIHIVERDWFDVRAMAEQGIYEKAAIEAITEDYAREDDEKMRERTRNQDETTAPSMRRRIKISEVWGTILDEDGKVVETNGIFAVANDKYVIRKLRKNPFWHGESPFVVAPLSQTPFTVWGKALYDDGIDLNFALNELFNLILDGGISAVWGVKQLHKDWLEDPSQVSGGIKQNTTLVLSASAPPQGKAVEVVAQGDVPNDALNVYNLLDREGMAAFLMNDLRLGFLPPRAVKATEVLESSQNNAVMVDSLAVDIERNLIGPAIRKAWLNILQHTDDLLTDDVIDAIGEKAARRLATMSPKERFATFATGCRFKVLGLSATLAKTRDFQRLAAFLQIVGTNPLILQAFVQRYSANKTIDLMMKTLNINPEDVEKGEGDPHPLDELQAAIALSQQMTAQAPTPASPPGQGTTQSEIGQNAAPTGMQGLQ